MPSASRVLGSGESAAAILLSGFQVVLPAWSAAKRKKQPGQRKVCHFPKAERRRERRAKQAQREGEKGEESPAITPQIATRKTPRRGCRPALRKPPKRSWEETVSIGENPGGG